MQAFSHFVIMLSPSIAFTPATLTRAIQISCAFVCALGVILFLHGRAHRAAIAASLADSRAANTAIAATLADLETRVASLLFSAGDTIGTTKISGDHTSIAASPEDADPSTVEQERELQQLRDLRSVAAVKELLALVETRLAAVATNVAIAERQLREADV
jgi:hypothetical protein